MGDPFSRTWTDQMDQITTPISTLESGKAQIVFVREDSVDISAYAAGVYDITEDVHLIGILAAGMKVIHDVEPGEYVFMNTIVGEEAIMKAEVKEGHLYHAFMSPETRGILGKVWLPFQPTRGGDTKQWNDYQVGIPNANGRAWFMNNLPSIQIHKDKALKAWELYNEEEKVRYRLTVHDGEPIP